MMILHESPCEFRQFPVTIALQKDRNLLGETPGLLDYTMRLAFSAALTAIFLMIVALIAKLMWNCNGEEGSGDAARATENSRLLSSKEDVAYGSYGTSGKDLESGSSSSEEDLLYDGKICVICYDDQRNCFFVPCGHCVACYTCANRIMKEESKCCPICRGIIEKIRKLHFL